MGSASDPQYSSFRVDLFLAWQLREPKVHVPKRDPGRSSVTFHDLNLEITQHHFCYILFIKNESLRLACMQGEGNSSPPLTKRSVKEFADMLWNYQRFLTQRMDEIRTQGNRQGPPFPRKSVSLEDLAKLKSAGTKQGATLLIEGWEILRQSEALLACLFRVQHRVKHALEVRALILCTKRSWFFQVYTLLPVKPAPSWGRQWLAGPVLWFWGSFQKQSSSFEH